MRCFVVGTAAVILLVALPPPGDATGPAPGADTAGPGPAAPYQSNPVRLLGIDTVGDGNSASAFSRGTTTDRTDVVTSSRRKNVFEESRSRSRNAGGADAATSAEDHLRPSVPPGPTVPTERVVPGTRSTDDRTESPRIRSATLSGEIDDRAEAPVIGTTADLIRPVEESNDWLHLIQDVRALETEDGQLESGAGVSARAKRTASDVFGSASKSRSLLSQKKKARGVRASTDVVLGLEATARATTDAGDLLKKSPAGLAVSSQKRSQVTTESRVRGSGDGKVVAAGSHWLPARGDMDTMLSKFDSREIENIVVTKGPYTSRLGPGFRFLELSRRQTPRFEEGIEHHGETHFDYKTNGAQAYARQSLWGGAPDYGYRLGASYRVGDDYHDGAGFRTPGDFKSRIIDLAVGYDSGEDRRMHIVTHHADQTDVDFPNMVFDLDKLSSGSVKFVYEILNQDEYDQLTLEGWFNSTQLKGDAQSEEKRRLNPAINTILTTGFTEADVSSIGYSTAVSWGEPEDGRLTLGTDLRFVERELIELNQYTPAVVPLFAPGDEVLYGTPPSRLVNPGLFADWVIENGERNRLTVGARLDAALTSSDQTHPRFGNLESILGGEYEQDFLLGMVFLDAEVALNNEWTVSAAVGVAQRAPTLHELYTAGPQLALLQNVHIVAIGNPNLDPEQLYQVDVSIEADYDDLRLGVNMFGSWIEDYITYELLDGQFGGAPFQVFPNGPAIQFINTDLATLAGGEAWIEADPDPRVTVFGTFSYVDGRDQDRNESGLTDSIRNLYGVAPGAPRGAVAGGDRESLPGIPPFDTRVGVRLHDRDDRERWGVEISARIVNIQNRVAGSLLEQTTPGFTVFDVRGHWQATEHLMLISGIENVTDKRFREHLDVRFGPAVFRPGLNAYVGTEVVY